MRLIVKEYVSELKEKDELDILISQIYEQKGYIADNQPKTGNRQYGVDIQMHNDTEILFFVVKQGNINRDIWNGNINAVRQSIEDIRDVIMNSLTCEERKKQIKIIVATNGYREESIRLEWSGYVTNNQVWNEVPIEINFMGIDDIVNEILDNLLNEYLFDISLHSAMRKALYFIGEGDYKCEYFEEIINVLIAKLKGLENKKKLYDKVCAALHLSSQMICQYAYDSGNNKIAIMVSEYVVIKYWKYLVQNDRLGKQRFVGWLIKYCKSYEKWNDSYIAKIEKVVKKEVILPNYNVVENRVLLYEILGYLASYANYLLDVNSKKAQHVLSMIICMINEYPYFEYAPYDSSVGIVIMIYRLLYYYKQIDKIKTIMKNQTYILVDYYKYQHKFPAPSDSFEEAMEIEVEGDAVNYDVAAFWGYYLLLVKYFDYGELFGDIKNFLQIDLAKASKCVWFLRKNEELLFYEPYAMNLAGEGIEINVEKNFETFSAKVEFIVQQYENEIFSFDEYSFENLEVIICRYYGYIPRVKFKMQEE